MSPIPSKGQVLQLFVLRDGDLVASELFAEGIYLLGREPECDVHLDHPNVSTVQLELHEGKVHLSGAGGFHLNGQRVAEAELTSADDVWIGPFMLKTRLVRSRRSQGAGAPPQKTTHRSGGAGGAALSLVPQPPPPPAMEFEANEVEALLSSPLQARAEPLPVPLAQPIPGIAPPMAEPVRLDPPKAPPAPAPSPSSFDAAVTPAVPTSLATLAASMPSADARPLPAPPLPPPAPIMLDEVDADDLLTPIAEGAHDRPEITDPEARPLPYIDDVTDGESDAPVERTRIEASPLGARAGLAAPPKEVAPVLPAASIDDLAAELAAEIKDSAPGRKAEAKASVPPPAPPSEAKAGVPEAHKPPIEEHELQIDPDEAPLELDDPRGVVRRPPSRAQPAAEAVRSTPAPGSTRPAPGAALPQAPAAQPAQRPASVSAAPLAPAPAAAVRSTPPATARPPSITPGSVRPATSVPLPAPGPAARKPVSLPHAPLTADLFRSEGGSRPAAREGATPLSPDAIAAKPASSRALRPAAPAPAPAKSGTSGGAGVMHARIFWDDTLVYSCSSQPGAPIFAAPAEAAALQLYGFAPQAAGDGPLVRASGATFRVQVPLQTQIFEKGSAGWTAASASQSREVQLAMGSALRLSRDRFHLELSAQPAPVRARGASAANLDFRLVAMVVVIALALGTFVHSLPEVIPFPPRIDHDQIRRIVAEMHQEKPPPKKTKPKPIDQVVKPPPTPIAEAKTLKQASVPLKSLDKIAKATRGISNLLASLTAQKVTKSDALSALPSVNRGPAPLPSLGGTGAGGPVTKGGELLRGSNSNLLAAATGGHGDVAGVPVSVPRRPSKVQGSIDRDAVAKVINDKVNEMRSCYERALLRDANLGAGKVILEWTIAPNGSVAEVRTKTATLRSPEVVSCLLDLLRTLEFPKPNGGTVIVTYPVLFNSVGY